MITIWKQKQGITEIPSEEKNCWIDVVAPTNQEIEKLVCDFGVPRDFIQDILDIDERSRTEVEGKWLLIIIRIPVYLPTTKIPYYTVPLGILINNNYTITICLYKNEIANAKLLERNKKLSIINRHNFVLYLLLQSATYYLKYMKEINKEIANVEDKLRKSAENKEFSVLMKFEKCLVYYITSLKSNEILITKLQRSKFVDATQIDEDLLEDVLIENKQASEMAKIYSDILTGLMDSFASIISNNFNTVLKHLTSITIILMIPTLISSIFGMNVPNFMENSPYAFISIIISSAVLSFLGVYWFRKRNWF